ncbi:MAG: biopolymer transporter ExbD [Kiritimatiellae bacterium]|nr:biopolymer transporter ExbD [Kiritimatiellia bacterium]
MARKPQENPELDMTPMIDVVFELIIFFVVTLTETQKKDETIELEDGQHGEAITPDTLPPMHMQIDIAKSGRISMGNVELSPSDVQNRVSKRKSANGGREFPILIRADFETKHADVRKVMDACTKAGIWRLTFMAVGEDKTNSRKRLGKYVKR